MATLVAEKGNDIKVWRAAGEFGAFYRQELVRQSAFCSSDEAEALFSETSRALEMLAADNDTRVAQLRQAIARVAETSDPLLLGEICQAFYAGLYEHFACYGSAIAFYHLSTLFLRELTGALHRHAVLCFESSGEHIPLITLVALGPAGRREFSPYCPLQLALITGQSQDRETQSISRYCSQLKLGFETCGLQLDGEITPLNPLWRGTVAEWGERLEQGLAKGKQKELIELLRLADHEALVVAEGGDPFREQILLQLRQSRRAIGDLVSRLGRLTSGIGILGGMRLEKNGPWRGLFGLLEHALLPLSAAVSALVLINRADAVDIPQRIRTLLGRRALDVETAEQLLQAWHILNELRLTREHELFSSRNREAALFIDVAALDEEKRHMLREALETIDNIQRQVYAAFSGMEV